MARSILSCIFALCVTYSLFSQESKSLVNMTAMPSSIVNGSVNVITGDYSITESIHTASGPHRYQLGHSYFSSTLHEGTLGDGWNFFHHHLLEVYQPDHVDFTRGPNRELGQTETDDAGNSYPTDDSFDFEPALEVPEDAFFNIEDVAIDETFYSDKSSCSSVESDSGTDEDESSSTSLFIGNATHRNHHNDRNDDNYLGYDNRLVLYLIEPSGGKIAFLAQENASTDVKIVTKNTGFTNVVGIDISGQSNIKNIKPKWVYKNDSWNVTLGDGTLRRYERQWPTNEMKKKRPYHAKHYRDYHLKKEVQPDGNIVIFDYNDKHEIIAVRSYNKDATHKFNELKFKQKGSGEFSKSPSLHVLSSDDKKFVYYFKKLNGSNSKYPVSGIKQPGKPYTRFLYSRKNSGHTPRIIKQESNDGYFVETKYYRAATNKVGSRKVQPENSSQKRFLKGRVSQQFAPVGPGGKKVTTHRYFYYKDKERKSGHCTVRDVYSNITRYFWNASKRLTKIEKRTKDNELLMMETFTWGKGKNQGYLLARTLYDENENPLLSRAYTYDKRGNVIEDSLHGRLMRDSGVVKIDNGLPEGSSCDEIIRRYSYSNDGFNLKLSECDPLGNYTYYEYYKGTNLLKSKRLCEGKETKKREFYFYDKNTLLCRQITDDGSSDEADDMRGVTERHITYNKHRLHRPQFGKIEESSEYYYDFKKKKEVLLKKTVNSYSKKGFLQKKQIFDADQILISTTEYDHDEIGRLIFSMDDQGRKENFTYDNNSRLKTKSGPRDDVSWSYEYDLAGRLIQETERQDDGLQLTTTYEYDLLGRKVAITDPQGNTTRYDYDMLDRVTKITYPTTFNHLREPVTSCKSFQYIKLGTKVIETSENGYTTVCDYSIDGKLFSKTFPDGTASYYRYDANGNMVRTVAPNHVRTYCEYDAFNRLTSSKMHTQEGELIAEKRQVYNAFHLVKEISPTQEILLFNYDDAGRKIATTLTSSNRILEQKTSYQYDGLSRVKEQKDDYSITLYEYDSLDRKISENCQDSRGNLFTYKTYAYDLEGNSSEICSSVMGNEAKSTTLYYAHARPKEVTDAEGHTWRYFYDFNYINRYGQGVIKKISLDPRGMKVVEIFDTKGNLSCRLRYDPFGSLLSKQELFYDKANNLVRTHDYVIMNGNIEDIRINEQEFGPADRVDAIHLAVGTAEQKSTYFQYNEFGQKSKTIHADGTRVLYSYDTKGRVKEFYADDKTVHYEYEYDASDRLLRVKNHLTGNETKRRYDALGNLVLETLESGLTTCFEYDKRSRLSKLILPDHTVVQYSYSPHFLAEIARLTDKGKKVWNYTINSRDLSGNILSCSLPKNAGAIDYSYDLLSRRRETRHPDFYEKAIRFDGVGNLLGLVQDEKETTYTYDFLSQLTSEKGEHNHSYSYDSLYNRKSLDGQSYSHNALHAVLTDGKKAFQYDKRANRIQMDDVKYRYDALDRLIEVQTSDTCRISYCYDAFDRRIQKKVYAKKGYAWEQTEVKNYLYHGQNEIGSTDDRSQIHELRILGEGLGAEIGASVALELDSRLFIPLHDRAGNITKIIDPESAEVIASYSYDAFGNETKTTHTIDNPWRFASKRLDPETGLINFGRRYYDPTLGRFLTHDPLGLKAGPNLFAYVLNSPLTHLDLYGLLDEPQAKTSPAPERSILQRSWDFIKEAGRSFKNAILAGLEKTIHHMPHFGRWNDKAVDKLRDWRGAPRLDRRPSGLYQIYEGDSTSSGNIAHTYANGVDCSWDDCEKIADQIKYSYASDGCPSIYVLYSESHGFCMDLLRAGANMLGITTPNISPLAAGIQHLNQMCIEAGTGKYSLITPHSLGGLSTWHAFKTLGKEVRGNFSIESIGSTKVFSRNQGFRSAQNHGGMSDLVTHISDPFGLISTGIVNRNFNFVGHPFQPPCYSHRVLSREYREVLKDIAGRHS